MKTFKKMLIDESTDIVSFKTSGKKPTTINLTQYSGGEDGLMLQIGMGSLGKYIQINAKDVERTAKEMLKWSKKQK